MGTGSGRIADLGPSLAEWSRRPRSSARASPRASSTGRTGGRRADPRQPVARHAARDRRARARSRCCGCSCRAMRRLARRARADNGPESWLATDARAPRIAAYGVGMFTFDAFAFIQVTFFFFILLGFTAVARCARTRAAAASACGAPGPSSPSRRSSTKMSPSKANRRRSPPLLAHVLAAPASTGHADEVGVDLADDRGRRGASAVAAPERLVLHPLDRRPCNRSTMLRSPCCVDMTIVETRGHGTWAGRLSRRAFESRSRASSTRTPRLGVCCLTTPWAADR